MSRSHHPRSRPRRVVGLLVAATAAITMATGGSTLAGNGNDSVKGSQNAPDKQGKSLYIVQMADPPVVAYTGGIRGLKATKPTKGQKVDPQSPAVVKYVSHLDGTHDARVAAVGGRKVYSYRFAFNGFTAELTAGQAARLAADARVVAVTKDSISALDTSTTPEFLGLNAEDGIWSTLSGNADGNPIAANGPNSGGAGEGVVVGIIDSGIWPENPSFSDRDSDGRRVYQQLPGWHGKCVPGEQFTASDCNQKLISAQWFGEGFGGAAGIKAAFPYEFVSARAADGHGVHTASTAAGNYGVDAVIDGFSYGTISGMAPRARIAVYKTCWGIAPEGGCPNSDNVAAIDQAVADGVDVINYSISGTSTNFRDPVEIAFLFAADAGVFVAASAGNSGPGASTVAHPSPWITTVAASTHDRSGDGSVTLGNGATYLGASITAGVGPAPIVTSDVAGLAGANPAEVALCFPGTLDPAVVTGKIVVCDRGVNARTDKSLAVRDAGGVGMVLVNTSVNSLNADVHYVPTVHLQSTDRAAVRAYAATVGATATIAPGVITTGQVTAPTMASFSSRGPLLAGGGDLLKPDITAPGVDVLAAYSPVAAGRNFDFLSGTSMSSPHMAGIAALMKDLYPGWSPAAIKSALMTTSYQTTKSGTPGTFGGPFDFGAGHVEPNAAMNPGLVFDAGFNDWLGFLCGTQLPTSFCTSAGVPVLDPSNLNVPSVAIGDLAGSQTVTRKITNVSGAAATFTATTGGLSGLSVVVSPAVVALAAGQSATVSITITNVTAPLNTYRNGDITWTSNAGHTARIPTVVRPVALAAPASVSGTGAAQSYDVTFGYNGAFSATPRGLVAATVTPGTVAQDPDQTFDPADPAGTTAVPVVIPAGTTYARFALFDSDVAAGADMDLYVYQGGTLVGSSAGGTSAEEVNFSFASPTGGPIALTVFVHGWGLPAGSSPFALHEWYLPAAGTGNMVVSAPATATLGATGTINLTFSGLAASTRYLGSVVYSGVAGMPAPTIVSINTP
ncbi:MAG: S8 family serine peptidase [Actinomycetota bacterium]|nr:S8 family serine peptidase [Actinomycetota bacterium]